MPTKRISAVLKTAKFARCSDFYQIIQKKCEIIELATLNFQRRPNDRRISMVCWRKRAATVKERLPGSKISSPARNVPFHWQKKRMPGIIVGESIISNENFLLEIFTLFCVPTKGAKAEQDRQEKKNVQSWGTCSAKILLFFIFFLCLQKCQIDVQETRLSGSTL